MYIVSYTKFVEITLHPWALGKSYASNKLYAIVNSYASNKLYAMVNSIITPGWQCVKWIGNYCAIDTKALKFQYIKFNTIFKMSWSTLMERGEGSIYGGNFINYGVLHDNYQHT